MIPIVNDKYQYIFFYNPKSACSVARKLFLDLHRDELTDEHHTLIAALNATGNNDDWSIVHKLFPFDIKRDYSNYYKVTLVRHPLTRFVSAYLNRVVMFQTGRDDLKHYVVQKEGDSATVDYSFKQFFDYIINTPWHDIEDTHYRPQSLLTPGLLKSGYNPKVTTNSKQQKKFDWPFAKKDSNALNLDAVCRMENLADDLNAAFSTIFKTDNEKLTLLDQLISNLKMMNVTLSDENSVQDACSLSANALQQLPAMPSYESFLDQSSINDLYKKYKEDYTLFSYSKTINNNVNKFESNKNAHFKDLIPNDFDWQVYLSQNPDLGLNGITSQAKAINHWIHHGRLENRRYK